MRPFCQKKIILFPLVGLLLICGLPQNGECLSPKSSFQATPFTEVDWIFQQVKNLPKQKQIMHLAYQFMYPEFPHKFKNEMELDRKIFFSNLPEQFEDINYFLFKQKWREAMEKLKKEFLFKFPSEKDFNIIDLSFDLHAIYGLYHKDDPRQNRFVKKAIDPQHWLQLFQKAKMAEILKKKWKELDLEETGKQLTDIYDCDGIYLHSYKEESYSLVQLSQLIEGDDLNVFVQENSPLDFQQTFYIIKQLLHGAILLKKTKVFHRDISDRNVMINPISLEIKIIDFGLAIEAASKEKDFDSNGDGAGTIPFLSWHVLQTNKRTYQDELWPIGILFYQLLIGKLPFSQNILIFMEEVQNQQSVFDLTRLIGEPVWFETGGIINKMLSNKKEELYQTAEEVLAAISEIEEKYFAVAL